MDLSSATESLHKNGYAIIEDFLTTEEIHDLKQRMKEIIDDLNPEEHQTAFSTTNHTRDDYFLTSCDKISFFFEEKALDSNGKLTVDKHLSINKIGHALHCLDPVFARITQSEKVKELMRAFQYVDPVIFQSMYIFKQPKIGGVVVPHQDSTFLNTTPKRLLGLWIPLEDAMIENSCIWFMPGSHKDGVHNGRYMIRNPKEGPNESTTIFTADARAYDDSQFVPAEMKAGSLLLIHGEIVHKSDPNTSTRSRHAYTFHVFDSHNCEYSKQNWLQPTDKGTFTHLFAKSS